MTFDVPLFALLSAFAVVALAIAVPGQVKGLIRTRAGPPGGLGLVTAGAIFQQSLFAVGLAAAGVALAPRVGLAAPWFEALAGGEGLAWGRAAAQLPAALLVGAVSTAVFLALYYRVFRPRMTSDDVARTEDLRTSMGLLGRVLMGGVVEEVMFRWGVMSVMAWLAISVLGIQGDIGMWAAIVSSGLLFALGHLPGVMAVGVKITKPILLAAITLNLLVALGFGWLFWQYGLLAAIIAHALLHAIWHPLEQARKA